MCVCVCVRVRACVCCSRYITLLSPSVPSSPAFLNVTVAGPHTITLTWSPPTQPNGTILAYTISYQGGGMEDIVVVGGNESWVNLTSLTPYTNYTLSVSANTSAGEGPAAVEIARTDEGGESHDLYGISHDSHVTSIH